MSGGGRSSKSVEWQQVVAREKTKFQVKVMQGKRKVKLDEKGGAKYVN